MNARDRLVRMIANEQAILALYERTLIRRNGGEPIRPEQEEASVAEARRRISMYESLLANFKEES